MTKIDPARPDTTEVAVIVGVDTHLDFHVAVVVDHLGSRNFVEAAFGLLLGVVSAGVCKS